MHAESITNLSKKSALPLLDRVAYPHDLKQFTPEQLPQLCDELRAATIEAVSKTGGHLGASLGVVELTAALHYVFDAPSDKIIWDVGHQAYPHKILTGRKDRIHTLRQGGGLSGFTKRDESVYDPFGAAHSSTSISAGLGMAVARDLADKKNHVICVIGDGALSAGMAYEALNNAGTQKSKMLVILNDNEMSIAPPVGAMSKYLTNIVSSKSYLSARDKAKNASKFLPSPLRKLAQRAEETARAALGGGTWFEEMGFYYIGPVDGHDVQSLTQLLKNIRESNHQGPVLLHALTRKGHGYLPAEHAPDKMHGVVKFDVVTGAQNKTKSNRPSYTKVFAESLITAARKDEKIVAITAAMPSGTGLDLFADQFPSRCFDVGIAEQHAVTFAGGLACEGYKPFVAVYSTFLQRAYDQIVHDIALQNLPVRFALDRAGLVGADGATHAGAFDIAYLTCLPNMVVMAPGDEAELMHMVATAAAYDDGPIAFRYPRGEGAGLNLPTASQIIPIGKGRVVNEGQDIAILSYGTRLQSCLDAANICKTKNLNITAADARFAKPLDTDLIKQLLRHHKILITVEEGSQNGFGACVLQFLANEGLLDKGAIVRNLYLPDRFQDHDTHDKQISDAQLDARSISQKILSLTKLL